MQIIEYHQAKNQKLWLEQIRSCEWRAAKYLATLLEENRLHEVIGRGALYLLTDGDRLVSFATLGERDCIDDAALMPWIGFVHTAPAYRGRRCAGVLIEHAVHVAAEHGAKCVYICTGEEGLYEKYGFTYVEQRMDIYGEMANVLVREV